ncbi:MAG TPA: hypothetical protein VF913_21550 [Xanthobacteraceae bacterium]
MPLQNRVTPAGELVAVTSRGLFMGNRGGRFHRDDRTLGARRWVSRAWICCVTQFKGRHRAVWENGYTELFFLDEPTALAAGHRSCFECRRGDALAFAASWAAARHEPVPPRAAEMDRVLHAERLDGRNKRRHPLPIDTLPDGAMLTLSGEPESVFALRSGHLLRWRPEGYDGSRPRPRDTLVDVLTPPSILGVLAQDYRPQWHPSAAACLTGRRP